MTAQINRAFLDILSLAVVETNRTLGIAPGSPHGRVLDDASDQDMANHEALVSLTRAVEGLQNWASEMTYQLQDEGIIEVLDS